MEKAGCSDRVCGPCPDRMAAARMGPSQACLLDKQGHGVRGCTLGTLWGHLAFFLERHRPGCPRPLPGAPAGLGLGAPGGPGDGRVGRGCWAISTQDRLF